MSIEESVDQVKVAGTAAATAGRQFPVELSLCRGGMTCRQCKASPQAPCTKRMFGLSGITVLLSFDFTFVPTALLKITASPRACP
jgi:hypothetical protein